MTTQLIHPLQGYSQSASITSRHHITSSIACDEKTGLENGQQRRVILPSALDGERHQIMLDGCNISYYSGGTGDGEPIVLLHSINAAPSAFEMKPLFDHFKTNGPVYVPELPGFGHSDRSNAVYSPERYAQMISQFITQVVKSPAAVVAFSLTSEFAAHAALLTPEVITSLALLSPTGFSKRGLPTGETSQRIHRLLSLPGLGAPLYKLLTTRVSIQYFLRRSYVNEPAVELIDYAYATSHQPGAHYAPLYFLSGQLFTQQVIEKVYSQLTQPVLVIYDRDANVGFERLPEVVASYANWQATRVTPTLGIPQWERSHDTVAALEAFWRHLPKRS
jgi:pimeloyl-ACP methyl ester carboxylesterase